MKKTTFICLGLLFMLLACDAGEYQPYQTSSKQLSTTGGNAALGKPARTDLAFIAQQLTNSYITLVDDDDTALSQKIILLDSVSLSVPLFTALKPVSFVLPTTTEAAFFLTDYEDAYAESDLSLQMMGYLDTVVQTENIDYAVLAEIIQADLLLTSQEKMQLHFIVTYLSDNAGGPIIDGSWKKKNIMAAVTGFEKSTANAVFNVALVKITQQ